MLNEKPVTAPSSGGEMLKGSIWMIALRWAIRLTGLVSTIVLARLLTPADFGIVAMAMVVVGMLEILNQTGQKLAIIRHPDPARAHYDTAWTLSVIFGLLIGLVIVIIAPFTSIYFHEPRAVPVMQWLALRAIIGGFENIGTVDFRRDLRFDRFFRYNMSAKITSFFVTIVLAIVLRNYWALVAGILSSQIALNVTSYLIHPYRPRFSLAKVGELWSFSGWTLFRTIGIYLNAQIDQVAVGGIFGAATMGRYSVASDIASSPLEEINGPMVAVLYPVMSRIQHDQPQVRALYLRTLCWSAIICASASVGVTMVAHDMVLFVLGEKWLLAERLIGWLALSAGLLGLSSGAYTTFDALGKPHLGARMQWVRLIFLAMAIVPVALLFHHPRYIAATRMVVTAVFMPTLFFAVGREIGVSWRDYVQALWRPFVAAGALALALLPLNALLPPGNLRLGIDVVTGVLVFGTTLLSLWWLSGCPDAPEKDAIALLRRYVPRKPGETAIPIEREAAAPGDVSKTTTNLEAAATSDDDAGRKAPLIYLYVPISTVREYRPLPRSRLGRIKAFAIRCRDRLGWTLLRSNAFEYYAWRTTEYTNRGDIAIREAVRQLLRDKFHDTVRFVELDWGELDAAAVAEINARASLFVIGGGGYVSVDAMTGRLSRVMNDVVALKQIRCPVVTLGIGYNCILERLPDTARALPDETVSKLRALAEACALIGCRDTILMRELGELSGKTISLIGDSALFLEPKPAAPLRHREEGELRLGLNFALHGPLSAAIFKQHFETYVSFLKRLQWAHRVTFRYFVHCETERVAIAMLGKRGLKFEVVDLPPREMIGAYKQVDLVVCQMLHSSILATNAGVPSLNIGYDVKNASFYDLMGLPELCIPHSEVSPERLVLSFADLLGRRAEIAIQLDRSKAFLLGEMQAFIEEIARLDSVASSARSAVEPTKVAPAIQA